MRWPWQRRPAADFESETPRLREKIVEARERVAEVQAREGEIDERVARMHRYVRENHLGPLIDRALGLK